tara:strand:- start:223 stop:909 length:687 start_codon:yes stop_codon:yes gene_type:complete
VALSSVSDVQSAIGIDVSTTDETSITNIFIPAADAAIKNYVGYELEYSSSITDTFDGNNEEELYTSVAPIVAISSLTEDAVAMTEGNQEHYVAYKKLGRLRKVNNKRWSDIRYQNISVTYSGGYSDSESSAEDIPKDIKLISARCAGRLFVASAALGSQQSTSAVSTHSADSSTDSQFQLVTEEKIGDYQAKYESVVDLMNQEVLTEADKSVLSKYKRQYFTSASILD